MRILFDKNVPHPLLRYLTNHDVHTAEELGWGRLSNGDLLRAAEDAGFGVMVTADQSLQYQQNLKGRPKEGSYEFVKFELPPRPKPGGAAPLT